MIPNVRGSVTDSRYIKKSINNCNNGNSWEGRQVNVWRQLVPKGLYFCGFVNVMTCQLQTKTEMLQNLLDIEIAYSMLKSGDEGTKDPIDSYYEKLKTELQVCGLTERLDRLTL